MKEYQKHILAIIVISSPLWGYFLFGEGLLYVLAGSRIFSLKVEPSDDHEALLVTTGAMQGFQTHLVTRIRGG